ncbi:MAG TPA: succinate dehydrogenase cytochrome b subunit [Candidatus Limnocylindrales bacterium]|nr:succinate dehydrogenase cytochrome b subunit [Candidatus Limnocylindrales bacterium]
MKRLLALVRTDIGRKALMGVTGLLLIAFLITHMLANLLVLFNRDGYNEYSHKLTGNPLIYLAELGLLVFFVSHFVSGILVWMRNRAARPDGYTMKVRADRTGRKSLASTTMIASGIVMLVFVPLHIATFKYGPWYTTADGRMRDLYRLVIEIFHSPLYTAWYLIALPVLGAHAWHGFGSGFESLGVAYSSELRRLGQAIAVVLTLGFMAVPVYVLLGGGAS